MEACAVVPARLHILPTPSLSLLIDAFISLLGFWTPLVTIATMSCWLMGQSSEIHMHNAPVDICCGIELFSSEAESLWCFRPSILLKTLTFFLVIGWSFHVSNCIPCLVPPLQHDVYPFLQASVLHSVSHSLEPFLCGESSCAPSHFSLDLHPAALELFFPLSFFSTPFYWQQTRNLRSQPLKQTSQCFPVYGHPTSLDHIPPVQVPLQWTFASSSEWPNLTVYASKFDLIFYCSWCFVWTKNVSDDCASVENHNGSSLVPHFIGEPCGCTRPISCGITFLVEFFCCVVICRKLFCV